MICPICNKGELINLGLLTCAYCKKMWQEWEFFRDCKEVGLAYYFTPNLNGTVVIYDPQKETHDFIELAQLDKGEYR